MSPDSAGSGANPPLAKSYTGRRFARFLYTQNPFYLLSVCFVLHSTGLGFNGREVDFSPWPLMLLICGYMLMMALTGFLLVRLGKVWDDARSILLIILLLMVELSLTFDDVLISQAGAGLVPSWQSGRVLLIAGLLFSVALSEAIFLGLRIRLGWLLRGPFHAMLMLFFLFPLLLTPNAPQVVTVIPLSWRIYLFCPLAAAALLALVPAVRRGPRYTAGNGTPWPWPLFPWSIFVFLTVCLVFRAYALSLSFDPVLSLPLAAALDYATAFGTYFLAPIVMALAVLLLEFGIERKNGGLQGLALAVPILGLLLCIPLNLRAGPYTEFLDDFQRTVGSPLWTTLLAAALFYLVSAWRGVVAAPPAFVASLFSLAVIGPQTQSVLALSVSTRPPPFWLPWWLQGWQLSALFLAAGIAVCLGYAFRRRSSGWGCCAAVGLLVALWLGKLPGGLDLHRELLMWHSVLLSGLILGAFFEDELGRLLKVAAAYGLVLTGFAAAVTPQEMLPSLPAWSGNVYLVGLLGVSMAYAWLRRGWHTLAAMLATGCVSSTRLLHDFVIVVQQLTGWERFGSFLLGLVWFVVAVAISVWKAGLGAWVLSRRKESL